VAEVNPRLQEIFHRDRGQASSTLLLKLQIAAFILQIDSSPKSAR
jgi:hypothetical protein